MAAEALIPGCGATCMCELYGLSENRENSSPRFNGEVSNLYKFQWHVHFRSFIICRSRPFENGEKKTSPYGSNLSLNDMTQ